MAKISAAQFELASRAADRANRLGALVFSVAKVLFIILSVAVVIGMFAIFKANSFAGYDTYTDWAAIWVGWGALIGAWLIYSFGLAMIALVGAVAQAKAESLDIQITQASGN
jgi:hypothetical protein